MIVNTATLLEKFLSSTGVSTDTRKIQAGNLFFALKGPNFNANALAAEALEKGAQYAIIDDADYLTGERTLHVEDGLLALQALATAYRQTLTIPIVGLTGSNGKTTTKELIFSVLSQKYHCFATSGNLNNHIGVPLSVLSIKKEHEIAVIEMGANKQGDIKELVEIAQPTHGLITNIGKAHLEGFGGIEGVRKGKGELFDFLKASGGITFLPSESGVVQDMFIERGMKNAIYTNTSLPATLVEAKPLVRYSTISGKIIDSHLPGIYNFENGISSYIPNNHRSQFIKIGSNQVLMDAYNANPSSMSAAISHFAETEGNPKIVILGDMFELGDDSVAEHAALGQLIAPLGFEKVLLVGQHMQHALIHLPSAYYFPDKFGLHTWLQDHPITDSFLLVKGSRGIQLESVLAFLENSK
jgi:UDP-N-acetylmuramoyl-tripeptide--D-alanyl-D-alanine ligase